MKMKPKKLVSRALSFLVGRTRKPRLIEFTLFWNEDHYFNEKVMSSLKYADLLVISEAAESFSGNQSRPFRVKQLVKNLPIAAQKRVIVVEAQLPPFAEVGAWGRERFLRNSGFVYMKEKGLLRDNDLLLVQDFDEFLLAEKAVKLINEFGKDPQQAVLHLTYYCTYYYLNYRIKSPENHNRWVLPALIKLSYLQGSGESPAEIRDRYQNMATADYVGWHHSYLGSEKFIENKIRAFSHFSDDGVPELDAKTISQRLAAGEDLLQRGFVFEKLQAYETVGIPELTGRKDLLA